MKSFVESLVVVGRSLPSRVSARWIAWPGLVLALGGASLTAGACTGRASSATEIAPIDVNAHALHVSPDGWSGGDGTRERPFDLQTALGQGTTAKPGDTVWLRGGTYKGGFDSFLTGTQEAPIVVRPLPGEHVIIDATSVGDKKPPLAVNGAWTIYRDLEILSANPKRLANVGVVVHGPNTKIVNMIIHDLTGGIAMWRDAVDAEAYGNIIYYNGWVDPADNRNKGHGIYTQNDGGRRRLTDNVIFNQFGAGIHAYGSSETFLDYMTFEGNVLFHNGGLTGGHVSNILLGGGRVAKDPVVNDNHSYSVTSGDNNLGYSAGCENLVMRNNHFTIVGFAFQLVNCGGAIEGNTLHGDVRSIEGDKVDGADVVQSRYPQNRYFETHPTSGVESYVRPNKYEPGRAHVIVYNWEKVKRVAVDLGPSGLKPGTLFQLRDVQNLAAPPVVTGTYSGGTVSIPMSALTETARLVGFEPKPLHTAPVFAVFLLQPLPATPSWFASTWSSIRSIF